MDKDEITFPEFRIGQLNNGDTFIVESTPAMDKLLAAWIESAGVPEKKKEKLQKDMTEVILGGVSSALEIAGNPEYSHNALKNVLEIMIEKAGGNPDSTPEL